MAKKVIKYEAKDGTLFDKWDAALAHDRDAGVRRWFEYEFTQDDHLSAEAIRKSMLEHFDLRPKPAYYHALKHIGLIDEEEERDRLERLKAEDEL